MAADRNMGSLVKVPFAGRFQLSRAELIANGVVHAAGIVLAVAGGSVLLVMAAFHTAPGEYAAAIFYVASLLTVMSVSCAYNMWPVSPLKWRLRRFDHAAIYLLIAGTYAPFLAQLRDRATTSVMTLVVWSAAAAGIAVKLFLPGWFDRLAVVLYLAIGWSGAAIAHALMESLPSRTLWLVLAGGIVYSCGVAFFAWHSLRFQAAIWHGFVVLGAGLHLAAVTNLLVIDRL